VAGAGRGKAAAHRAEKAMTANNAHCPRCRGPLIKDMDMDGTIVIKCMSCARTFGRAKGDNGSYNEILAIMGAAPGLTATTTLERFEDIQAMSKAESKHNWALAIQRRRDRLCIQDNALAEAVARRLGITLQDLRLVSRRPDDQARLNEAIMELDMLGLTWCRIAAVLERDRSSLKRKLARLKAERNHS